MGLNIALQYIFLEFWERKRDGTERWIPLSRHILRESEKRSCLSIDWWVAKVILLFAMIAIGVCGWECLPWADHILHFHVWIMNEYTYKGGEGEIILMDREKGGL